MRSFLPICLLSFCALNAHVTPIEHREELREIFQIIGSRDYSYALEKIQHHLHHLSNKDAKVHLLQERAFLHLVMQSPQDALNDLDTIISMESHPSEGKEYGLVKALWMHLAISAWLQDSVCVLKDLEQLKKWDKSFPKVELSHGTAYVVSNTNSTISFYPFAKMLEGFGFRTAWDRQVITLNAGYFEVQISETANHHLVELAAACAFTDSPWGSAAWEYVGKTFAPYTHWKNDFPKYMDGTCRELLRDLER
jgi:hypothetical protein